MATQRITNIGGLNLYVNPLQKNINEPIRAVNVASDFYGAKNKRPGYGTFLGTADGSVARDLFSFYKNDGTSFWLYRVSGSKIYYSTSGTGEWTVCGNGTVSPATHVSHAVLDNTMIVADGVGSTRHTTDGTSFTDTTLAPISVDLEMYQNRIYAAGTSSDLFYSASGNAADWATSGTSDSSSFKIPGAGKLSKVFKSSDRLVSTKNSGLMFRWDGYNLTDMSTQLGPTSPQSLAQVEGYQFYLNRLGVFGYSGNRPELISNAIQRKIYNNSGSAIAGAVFDSAPGVVHRYDYMVGVGTVTEDFTGETVVNNVIKYDFNKNEFLDWSLAHAPSSFHSYKDTSGNQQLIFGGPGGQCYKFSGTATTDAGTPIEAVMEFVLDGETIELDKRWVWFFAFFNPSARVKVSVAMSDSYVKEEKRWVELTDFSNGVYRYRFPADSRSKLLFIKIYDYSANAPFTFYGATVESEAITL